MVGAIVGGVCGHTGRGTIGAGSSTESQIRTQQRFDRSIPPY